MSETAQQPVKMPKAVSDGEGLLVWMTGGLDILARHALTSAHGQ
jgi:hypothetical protein